MVDANRSRRWILAALTATGIVGACTFKTGPYLEDGTAMLDHRVRGEGSAVIVFEAGLGEDLSTFERLAERLSAIIRTLVCLRLGCEGSPDARGERSVRPITDELGGLLDQLDLRPPVLLVAQSLGAIYAETYTRRFPDQVAGLILLDPPVRELDETIEGEPADLAKEWMDARRALSNRSSRGRHVIARKSGHDIHDDEPDLMAAEINSMLEALGAR